MDIINSYAENIIDKKIKMIGKIIEFKKPILNRYKEVIDDFEIILKQKGIYHSASFDGNMYSNQKDAGKNQSYRVPMILMYYNEKIKVGDYCSINNLLFRITDIKNYNLSNKFVDVFLEEIRGKVAD